MVQSRSILPRNERGTGGGEGPERKKEREVFPALRSHCNLTILMILRHTYYLLSFINVQSVSHSSFLVKTFLLVVH